jgi:hypothetical protein
VLGCLTNSKDDAGPGEATAAKTIVLPLLELQQEHFLYHVIEHAADESVHDGEALDFKISALLAAQAAVAAIFIAKGWAFVLAAGAFTILALTSILSLQLWKYRRAPIPERFATDYLRDSRGARTKTILDKLASIDHNEALVAKRSIWYTWLLRATAAALLVSLVWYVYNGYEDGLRKTPPGPAAGQQSRLGPAPART